MGGADLAQSLGARGIERSRAAGACAKGAQRLGVRAHGAQELGGVRLGGRRDELGEGELERAVGERPRRQLRARRMTTLFQRVRHGLGAGEALGQGGHECRVARRPEPDERQREKRAAVATVAGRDRGRELHDRAQELRVVAHLDRAGGIEGRQLGGGDAIAVPAHDERGELDEREPPGAGAEKEREQRGEVVAPIVDGRGAHQEHARIHGEGREARIAFGAGRARVVRLVEDEEIGRDAGNEPPAQRFVADQLHGRARLGGGAAPHAEERGGRDDERGACRSCHGQRDEGLAQADVVGEQGAAVLGEHAQNARGRGPLVGPEPDEAELGVDPRVEHRARDRRAHVGGRPPCQRAFHASSGARSTWRRR